MKKLKERLSSYVVWLAILGYVSAVLIAFVPELNDKVQIIAQALLGILVTLGILNNPTDKTQF